MGYVLEVMRHEAFDYVAEHDSVLSLENRTAAADEREPFAVLPEDRRLEAIELARRLIPRLGQDSVQSVMRRILDAIEDGVPSITTADLAMATGMTEDGVRQCRSRGFRRLERIVRDEGLEPPSPVHVPDTDRSRRSMQ